MHFKFSDIDFFETLSNLKHILGLLYCLSLIVSQQTDTHLLCITVLHKFDNRTCTMCYSNLHLVLFLLTMVHTVCSVFFTCITLCLSTACQSCTNSRTAISIHRPVVEKILNSKQQYVWLVWLNISYLCLPTTFIINYFSKKITNLFFIYFWLPSGA